MLDKMEIAVERSDVEGNRVAHVSTFFGFTNPWGSEDIEHFGFIEKIPIKDLPVDDSVRLPPELTNPVVLPNGYIYKALPSQHIEVFDVIDRNSQSIYRMYRVACMAQFP